MFTFRQTNALLRASHILYVGSSTGHELYADALLVDRAYERLCREMNASKVDKQAAAQYRKLFVNTLKPFMER